MNEEDIQARLNQIKDLVIFANTRINYLQQLNKLIMQKNRMIFRFEGFYAMVLRDFNFGILGAVRALVENRRDTHNISTLVNSLHQWAASNLDEDKQQQLASLTKQLSTLVNNEVASRARIIASTSYAHKSLKLPQNKLMVTYRELKDFLNNVGELLNKISGLLWDSSTVLYTFESDGDSFEKEMLGMERAEHVGVWLLRLQPEHEAVARADELLSKKDLA